MVVLLLAKNRKSKSFTNKSIKQSKRSARGRVGKKNKGQNRKATSASRGRLGGGGPAPHNPSKRTQTTTSEPEELTPGSLEETSSLRETGSTFKADELELKIVRQRIYQI
jgi:hypothetical protein